MPFPLSQLALVIQLRFWDLALVPETVLLVAEHGEPEALRVVARFGVDAFHVAQEEILQHLLVELLRVLVDRFASDGEDGAGLEAHGERWTVVAEVVEEFFEVLSRSFGGPRAFEQTLWRGPLGPAGVFLPGDTVPEVEELHCTVWEGSDASRFGVEGYFLHLQRGQIGVIINAALGEEGDILEAVVVLDDVG